MQVPEEAFLIRRKPRVPPKWPQARIVYFSFVFLRRLESLHFYIAKRFGGS